MNEPKINSLKRIARNFDYVSTVFLFVAAVALITGIARCIEHRELLTPRFGWHLVVSMCFLVAACARPISKLATEGYSAVRSVCVLSGGLLVSCILVFYVAFFAFNSGIQDVPAAADKILNVPPVLVAIWGASLGWYVHFQASMKNQRTANAFAIILQTRTNTEFLKQLALVRRYFPAPQKLDDADRDLFSPRALFDIRIKIREEKEKSAPDQTELGKLKQQFAKARAIDAFRYLLNFYEHIAVAIKGNDLDELMLYETISPHVVGLFDRAEAYRRFMQSPDGANEILAFEHMEEMIPRWRRWLQEDKVILQARLSSPLTRPIERGPQSRATRK